MKVRLLKRMDGGVSVVHPAPKSRREGESEQDWLTRVFERSNPNNIPFEDVDDSSLPSRRFRDEWVGKNSGMDVDIVKAKVKVIKELRTVRNAELSKTDGDMARENDIGDVSSKNVLKKYRQGLRDVPGVIRKKMDSIDSASDLELQYPKVLTIDQYMAK